MLTTRIHKSIKYAVVTKLLADEARERGDKSKAAKWDAAFEAATEQLGNETLELIRARKAELAR